MKNNEYPENREWKQKAFGMPKLPSGDMGQDKVLYYILKMVKDGKSANIMLNIKNNKASIVHVQNPIFIIITTLIILF